MSVNSFKNSLNIDQRKILYDILQASIRVLDNTTPTLKIKSLFSGELGVGLFLSALEYNNYTYPDMGQGKKVLVEILNNNSPVIGNSICNGSAGIYWLLSRLNNKVFTLEKDFLEFLKSECIKGLETEINKENFDYLHGAFGILHSLLLSDSLSFEEIKRIEELILNSSVNNEIFPTLYSPVKDVKGINLHLAHGISAYIIVLCEMFERTKNKEIIPLITNHCELLKRNYKSHGLSCFPFLDNLSSNVVRNAWCYGDLGIGMAFFRASQSVDHRYYDFAISIWERTCGRKSRKSVKVFDSPICHGIFGNLMFYYQINKYVGGNEMIKFTIDSYLKVIQKYYSRFGDDFLKYSEIDQYAYHRSFLTGVSGIGLVCMEILDMNTFKCNELLLI